MASGCEATASRRRIACHGAVGFVPSPLPRMRGRAVVPRTILPGEKRSGSTLFWLADGADTGDILLQRTFAVAPDATAGSLCDQHLGVLVEMLPEAVRLVAAGDAPRRPQDHDAAT